MTYRRCKVGIQPTYEELKPVYMDADRAIDFSIQPTYEELKLTHTTWRYRGPHGIQPTYEELKPGKRLQHSCKTGSYPAYL